MIKRDKPGALTSTVKKSNANAFQMVLNLQLARGFVCQTNSAGETVVSKRGPEIADCQNRSEIIQNHPKYDVSASASRTHTLKKKKMPIKAES